MPSWIKRLNLSDKSAALRAKLAQVRPHEFMEQTSRALTQTSLGTYARFGAVALGTYFLADTASLFLGSAIPEAPPIPALPFQYSTNTEKHRSQDEFASITGRNILNSKGIIPEDSVNTNSDGPARKSNLPLNLVGTVVMQDPAKSIASIEDKSQNQIFPARIEETFSGKITIKKIEHMRVTFVNLASNALEYIEIPEEQINGNVVVRPSAISKGNAPIEKEGEGRFAIQKGELDKAFGNLNEILTQAKAIPNFENGQPAGYKIIQIVPGSIYTKLGINEGDVLTSVNGEPMNDPGKAFQLLNELRSGAGHLELSVKGSDGKTRTQSYDVGR